MALTLLSAALGQSLRPERWVKEGGGNHFCQKGRHQPFSLVPGFVRKFFLLPPQISPALTKGFWGCLVPSRVLFIR